MKVNGFFFHLFLMEKGGIKGQFLTLKVGANSVFFPVLGSFFPSSTSRSSCIPDIVSISYAESLDYFEDRNAIQKQNIKNYRIFNLQIAFLLGRIQDAHSGH